jgi:hypothetical protein
VYDPNTLQFLSLRRKEQTLTMTEIVRELAVGLVVSYCPSVVGLTPVHMLVLFLFFFVHLRNSETALGRQVSNIVDYFPHFLITESPFPCRHS